MTDKELMEAQIRAMEANTRAMEAYTAALCEHTSALHEQAEAQKKLERTLHLIFEDGNGYVVNAADCKLRGLHQAADKFIEAAARAEGASQRFSESAESASRRFANSMDNFRR